MVAAKQTRIKEQLTISAELKSKKKKKRERRIRKKNVSRSLV